jgi:hypothetical protein
MRQKRWLWVAALVGLSGGCCGHPGVFQKIHDSMVTVQYFYDPLIQQEFDRGGMVQQAMVAADTTLLLASELQQQWCPNPDKAKQLELQTQEAKKLAQEAGVVEAGASHDQISLQTTE